MTERIIVRHETNLNDIEPRGFAEVSFEGGELTITSRRSFASTAYNLKDDCFKKHFSAIPGRYRIPFAISMEVNVDHPSFLLLAGGGHVSFASPWQDNRKIDDISVPSGKPNLDRGTYENWLPYGKYAEVSVTYGLKFMRILIDGRERFYSEKLPYMKARDFMEKNAEGFALSLVVAKRSELRVKSVSVAEYDGEAEGKKDGFTEKPTEKPNTILTRFKFEDIIESLRAGGQNHRGTRPGLSEEFVGEIIKTDEFLRGMKPLKFKRAIDKSGSRVSYVAPEIGFSYAVNVSGAESSHGFGWYIVTNGPVETWKRKADLMEETLDCIAETDAGLASRIFNALNDCAGCYPHGLCKTLYSHGGEKRLTCHGRVVLRMDRGDFEDARKFILLLANSFKTAVNNPENSRTK